MMRGSAVLEIWPKLGSPMLVSGLLNSTLLNTLKASTRNSNRRFSRSRKILESERLVLNAPGPRRDVAAEGPVGELIQQSGGVHRGSFLVERHFARIGKAVRIEPVVAALRARAVAVDGAEGFGVVSTGPAPPGRRAPPEYRRRPMDRGCEMEDAVPGLNAITSSGKPRPVGDDGIQRPTLGEPGGVRGQLLEGQLPTARQRKELPDIGIAGGPKLVVVVGRHEVVALPVAGLVIELMRPGVGQREKRVAQPRIRQTLGQVGLQARCNWRGRCSETRSCKL